MERYCLVCSAFQIDETISPACSTFQIARKRYATVSLSSYRLVSFVCFLFHLQIKSDLDICFDLFHAFLESKLSTVQAQIIISCICPLVSCMVTIEITAKFIRLLDVFFHFFFCHTVTLHRTIKTEFLICMNKHTDNIWIVFQNIICTSSNCLLYTSDAADE